MLVEKVTVENHRCGITHGTTHKGIENVIQWSPQAYMHVRDET